MAEAEGWGLALLLLCPSVTLIVRSQNHVGSWGNYPTPWTGLKGDRSLCLCSEN